MLTPRTILARRVTAALDASPSRIPVLLGGCGSGRTTLLRQLRDRIGRTSVQHIDVERTATTPERFLRAVTAVAPFPVADAAPASANARAAFDATLGFLGRVRTRARRRARDDARARRRRRHRRDQRARGAPRHRRTPREAVQLLLRAASSPRARLRRAQGDPRNPRRGRRADAHRDLAAAAADAGLDEGLSVVARGRRSRRRAPEALQLQRSDAARLGAAALPAVRAERRRSRARGAPLPAARPASAAPGAP